MANYFDQYFDEPEPPDQPQGGNFFDSVFDSPQQQAPQQKTNFFDDVFVSSQQQPQAPPEPEAEGTIGTVLRSAAHSVLPSVGGLAGVPVGIAGGAAAFGLPTAGLGALPGAVVGGIGAYAAGSKLQESALNAMGFDDSQQQAVNAKTNPKSALAGEILGALPTVGLGAGLKAITRLGGAIGGGLLEAGSQALGSEPWDPTRIAGAAGAGGLLIKPTRLGEAVGSGTAKAIGRPELWHGSGGPDAAAGTSKEQPPPRETPGAGAELPTDYYAKPPRVTETEAPPTAPGEPAARVTEGEAPPAVEAAPAPQVTPVDPAIDAAVNKRPIEPRVTEVEPPTQYGPALDREFPRVTEMPAEAPPVAETPGVENLARTPREAMAQKAPEETYGQVLRRLVADERGGARPPDDLERAKIRLGQLLRDKAATKKSGYDVDSSDYSFYNTQIRNLRQQIKDFAADERGGGRNPPKPPVEEPGAGPVARATAHTFEGGVGPEGSARFDPNRIGEIRGGLIFGATPNMWGRLRDGTEVQLNAGADVLFGGPKGDIYDPNLFTHMKSGQTNGKWVPVKKVGQAEAMPTPGVIEGAAIPGAKAKADAALADRGFTPEEIAKMKPKEKTAILQKRQGEVGSGPKGDEMLQQEAAVRAGPAAEALDLKLASRMLNQPAVLRSEAAKRGITPEALRAQAFEALKTPALPGRPAEMSPVGGGVVTPTPTRPPSPAMVAATGGAPPATPTPPAAAAAATGGAPPVTPPPAAAAAATPTPPAARPTLRAAHPKDLADGLWAAIRRTFVPELSPSGRAGMDVFREHKGETTQMKEAQLARFDNAMHYATNKMSDIDQRKLVNYIEGGQHLNTPGHAIHDPNWRPPPIIRRVADQIKQGYAAFEHTLSQLPQAAQANFLQDYLTHMYKNPQPLIDRIGTGAGNFGSLRKRVHETYEHAREAGHEPLTNNPIEIFTRYAMGAERAISKQKTINDLEARGYLGWFKPKSVGATGAPEAHVRGSPPEGYAPVPSFVNKQGATAYVPKDMAYVMNHQFGPAFQSPSGEKIVDALRRFQNFTTSLELGMSLYHPFTVGVETIARGMKRSIEQMGTHPDQIARASKTLIKAFGEPISNVPLGREWIERYTGKRASSVEQQRILDAMKAADIRPVGIAHTMEYDLTSSRRKTMGELGSLWTSYQRGSLEREFKESLKDIMGGDWKEGMMFAPNLASRILRTAAQPIFETYIPRMKIASLALDLQAYIAQNPTVSKENLAVVARKMSSSIDRTMGEMVTDHIGMNKAWKSAAFIGMRSYSFTIGGPSELVGGLISGAKGALKGENRYSMSSPHYDPKAASPIAYGVLIGGLAAMWNYMRTGEFPQDWRDYVTPRTGGTVMSGGQPSEERILLPGYHKDFLGYAFHPKEEVSAKMAGVVNAFKEQITGKDYRGDPIAPPVGSAGLGANIAGRAEHLSKALVPLSFKQISEPDKTGSNIHPVEKALGFRAPGAYIQNPERIAQVKEIVEQKAWRTRERHINADRAAKGLPPIPPMRFEQGGQ